MSLLEKQLKVRACSVVWCWGKGVSLCSSMVAYFSSCDRHSFLDFGSQFGDTLCLDMSGNSVCRRGLSLQLDKAASAEVGSAPQPITGALNSAPASPTCPTRSRSIFRAVQGPFPQESEAFPGITVSVVGDVAQRLLQDAGQRQAYPVTEAVQASVMP